ncbi:hypothetical protein L7F22_063367 [Adiantum nelumboides]|nr:hypothetical protein [Adiantum nelumboides]
MTTVVQFLALMALFYLDGAGMWGWGFMLCTIASTASLAMLIIPLNRLHQFKAAGNPFFQNIQVLVAACRNYSLSLPEDLPLLFETEGKLSAIPGCRKLQHTTSLRFLDKAAVVENSSDVPTTNPWHLCIVSQVEELKSVLHTMPAGIAIILVATANAQGSTLFEEQANGINREVTSGLTIYLASPNLISMARVSKSRFKLLNSIITGCKSLAIN